MSERRACILIAAILMLSGAGVSFYFKQREPERSAEEALAALNQAEEESFLSGGKTEESYGAVYDEELNQWTMQESMGVRFEDVHYIHSPVSGVIHSISGNEDGTSRICIRADDCLLMLEPVFNVAKFTGSPVEKGEKIGSAEGIVWVRCETDGRAKDPLSLFASNQP